MTRQPVGPPLGGEDDGRLVAVDHKTDDVPAEAWPLQPVFYAPQLRGYADIVGRAVGYARLDPVLSTSKGTVAARPNLYLIGPWGDRLQCREADKGVAPWPCQESSSRKRLELGPA